ncbi:MULTISPECIES: WxL domain-containing protein [unclassified Enterococcus]|uniref:WxL domain-containing protein n=1 Tax=unclassified Enterococcus TaxID=2608891 RepID=UPI0013EC51B1|nr:MULTISPECIES: WxL domain-containing protein [unclassified Enterococcus]
MKKQVFYTLAATALLSSSLLSTLNVHADETAPAKDATTSTAKIAFTGGNDDPVHPLVPDDPDDNGTGDHGPLSIDHVSDITFGTQEISASEQVYNAENAEANVQITDKRGVEGGWTLTAATSKFTAEDHSELKGAVLSFKGGETQTTLDNTSASPEAHDVTFDNTEAKPVMTADSLKGQGTWVDIFQGTQGNNNKIQLQVPSGSAEAKEYTATITWTLTAGPTE